MVVQFINIVTYFLTYFDSFDIKLIISLILRKSGEKRKNICTGRKSVVILHPQSGNEGAQK